MSTLEGAKKTWPKQSHRQGRKTVINVLSECEVRRLTYFLPSFGIEVSGCNTYGVPKHSCPSWIRARKKAPIRQLTNVTMRRFNLPLNSAALAKKV